MREKITNTGKYAITLLLTDGTKRLIPPGRTAIVYTKEYPDGVSRFVRSRLVEKRRVTHT